jgi:hypothetical protein
MNLKSSKNGYSLILDPKAGVSSEPFKEDERCYYKGEKVICKQFGCGKTLTLEERLCSDRCNHCNSKKKLDPTLFSKV